MKYLSIFFLAKGCGTSEPINMNSLKNYTRLVSPGYPDGYAPDLLCEWVFTTIPMNHILILFVDMDLQPTYGSICYADYVEVFEKRLDSDWTSVLKTCRENITSRDFIHTSNIMKVVFKTDRFANRTGFVAYIREGKVKNILEVTVTQSQFEILACGGTLTDPYGHIIYNNNTRVGYGTAYKTEVLAIFQ